MVPSDFLSFARFVMIRDRRAAFTDCSDRILNSRVGVKRLQDVFDRYPFRRG
jgi:hypothetical protein